VLDAAEAVGARDVVVAGLDAGGIIVFAAARKHAARIRGAAVMNTVVPGVDPWDEVLTDPRILHFAFHAIPDLPETLVRGRERPYFDFFLDFLSGRPDAVDDATRRTLVAAYSPPEALTTGFQWYRTMVQDAELNRRRATIDTRLLYVRGDAEQRPIEPYVAGLEAAGTTDARPTIVAGSGEFLPLEPPEQLVSTLSSLHRRDRSTSCSRKPSTTSDRWPPERGRQRPMMHFDFQVADLDTAVAGPRPWDRRWPSISRKNTCACCSTLPAIRSASVLTRSENESRSTPRGDVPAIQDAVARRYPRCSRTPPSSAFGAPRSGSLSERARCRLARRQRRTNAEPSRSVLAEPQPVIDAGLRSRCMWASTSARRAPSLSGSEHTGR
jgi:hypothetical protein